MTRIEESLLISLLFLGFCGILSATPLSPFSLPDPFETIAIENDTIKPRSGDHITDTDKNPFDLKDPSIVDKDVEYDPETGQYIITERIGDEYFRTPTYLSFEEYLEYKSKEQDQYLFKRMAGVSSAGDPLGLQIDPVKKFDIDKKNLIDRLFGGSDLNLNPRGRIDLTFGFDYQNVENPVLLERQQRNGGFDFDMDIQMSLDGSIGDKLKINAN